MICLRSHVTLIAVFPALLLAGGCNSCGQLPGSAASGGTPSVPPAGALSEPVRDPDVLPPECAVVASASADEGQAPLLVQFTAEGLCTDRAGRFLWSFGDDTPTSDEQNPTHTYAQPGTFIARVTLEDPESEARDADALPITVVPP